MLDKSQGLTLGSELWSDTGVIVGTGWTVASGVYTHTAGIDTFQKNIGLVTGKTYQVTFTVTGRTAGNIGPVYGGSVSGPTVTANGTYTQCVASGTNALLYFQPSIDFVGSVSGISVKLLAGNHATQATSGQRPTYGVNPITGTRNLLTYTEQFDNAAWTKLRATVTANATTSPDGTSNADTLLNTAVAGTHVSIQTITKAASALPYTSTVYLKKSTLDQGELRMSDQSGNGVRCTFNLTTVAVEASIAFGVGFVTGSSQITDAGNGWYRVTITGTTNAAVVLGIEVYIADASGNISYTGTGAGFFVWGAQLEQSATATAYQKVVTQYEVTEAGVQSASYISFDGTDDGMVTGTITPAIDRVQMFAGVRKLSDATRACIAEFGSGGPLGSFSIFGPSSSLSGYSFTSTGSSSPSSATVAGYTAPITNVVTGIGEIAANTAVLRVNSSQVASSATVQGSGNYNANPLYIGRRGGSSLPFNGRLYSLIVRFGANLTTGQITATESWVNSKTGAY
jgi:hypothetical protein